MTESKILAHSLTSKERTRDVILTENVSFSSLILPQEISKGLSASGFEKPSPIQIKALPVGRCGFDLIVKSKSGTGKTLVFAVISLESINIKKCNPQVLIVAPTREIAVQIQDVIKNIGKYYEGLSVESFIGGLPLSTDKIKCKTCHIAVGTPGRLKQLIQEGDLKVEAIKILVLDEADKLTENSFQNDINEIYNSLPDRKQIIMCSATYPDEMQLLSQYMRSPVVITVELETPLLLGLRQYVKLLKFPPNIVQQTKAKNSELLKIIGSVSFVQCLVFSNYQNRAQSISSFLNGSGWNSIFMSASQNQTERLNSLSDLKDFKCKILVTTDLTARGIDAPNVDLVINYDIPVNAMTYLHRMGRAGRYGSTGNCINLAFIGQESKLLQNILGFIGGQNLSIPILDDDFNLDVEKIPKENYLFGEVVNFVKDFNIYSNEISEIRSSLTESDKKDIKRKKKAKKSMPNASKENDIINGVIKDNLNENDVSSVLAQLASGSFEMNSINTDKFDTKNNLYKQLLNSDDTTATCQKVQNKADQDVENSKQSSSLLEQLAEAGEIATLDLKTTDIQEHRNQLFYKNKALCSVAKMLSNVEVSNDDCSDLSAYFSTLKSQQDLEMHNKQNTNSQQPLSAGVLENIFSLAYKSQVSKEAEKWQNFLSDADKERLNENYHSAVEDNDENEDESGLFDDEDYDFEVEKDIEVKYTQNVNDYSFMEWVPVEPDPHKQTANASDTQGLALQNSHLAKKKKSNYTLSPRPNDVAITDNERYYRQYNNYFQHCSSNLWQNGLTFNSVRDFDLWFFNDWERQLGSVRDFVQKKIYVEEMSNFH